MIHPAIVEELMRETGFEDTQRANLIVSEFIMTDPMMISYEYKYVSGPKLVTDRFKLVTK